MAAGTDDDVQAAAELLAEAVQGAVPVPMAVGPAESVWLLAGKKVRDEEEEEGRGVSEVRMEVLTTLVTVLMTVGLVEVTVLVVVGGGSAKEPPSLKGTDTDVVNTDDGTVTVLIVVVYSRIVVVAVAEASVQVVSTAAAGGAAATAASTRGPAKRRASSERW